MGGHPRFTPPHPLCFDPVTNRILFNKRADKNYTSQRTHRRVFQVVFVSYCLTALAVQAFAQQRSVPPAFARPSQGRFSAAADLEPEQPVPQPFRRVSLPLYRGRGFGKTAAEGPAQQTFQSSTASAPVEGNGFVRDGGLAVTEVQPPTRLQGPPLYLQQQQQQQPERNQLQLQADRISQLQQQQQSAVDRAEDREVASVQQQPTDRVQLQPENPFRPLQVIYPKIIQRQKKNGRKFQNSHSNLKY